MYHHGYRYLGALILIGGVASLAPPTATAGPVIDFGDRRFASSDTGKEFEETRERGREAEKKEQERLDRERDARERHERECGGDNAPSDGERLKESALETIKDAVIDYGLEIATGSSIPGVIRSVLKASKISQCQDPPHSPSWTSSGSATENTQLQMSGWSPDFGGSSASSDSSAHMGPDLPRVDFCDRRPEDDRFSPPGWHATCCYGAEYQNAWDAPMEPPKVTAKVAVAPYKLRPRAVIGASTAQTWPVHKDKEHPYFDGGQHGIVLRPEKAGVPAMLLFDVPEGSSFFCTSVKLTHRPSDRTGSVIFKILKVRRDGSLHQLWESPITTSGPGHKVCQWVAESETIALVVDPLNDDANWDYGTWLSPEFRRTERDW